MKPCSRCHRHARRAESAYAWSLGALLIACGPSPAPAASESSTSGTTSATNTTVTPTTGITTTAASPTSTSCSCEETCDAGDESVGGPELEISCDVYAQDCCPGRKCAAWSPDDNGILNGAHCVPVTGDQALGQPCTRADDPLDGRDDCQAGARCWDLDEMKVGTCVPLCTGGPDDTHCPPGLTCLTSNDVVNVCLPPCDPLAHSCAPDEVCIPTSSSFVCIVDASGDAGQVNDACSFVNGCDPGLVCLSPSTASSTCDPDASGCCQPFCAFPGAPCPNPDQACVQWFDPMMPIPPGDQDIGACAVPA